jgi:DNA-binding CsgD family transcriptional regulator
MQMSSEISSFAHSLVQDCDIASTCVMISDKTMPSTRLRFLGNFGVSDEVLDRYERFGICDADPFTDTLIYEQECAGMARFHGAADPDVKQCGSRAAPYWQFVSHEDVDVVGASVMRLHPRIYLTIGAHRLKDKTYRKSVPVERLAWGMDVLQSKIASSLLSALLSSGPGYKGLLEVLNGGAAEADPVVNGLTVRERQVTQLVCDGKRNKEIAWLAQISEHSVENHLRRIYRKLGIQNRAALVSRMSAAGF